jgi:hypothetical protein
LKIAKKNKELKMMVPYGVGYSWPVVVLGYNLQFTKKHDQQV